MQEAIPGLVSVVIPVYNRSGMLRRAVDSVLAQTWSQFEVIISDDGSTDDTPGFIESLCCAYPDRIRSVRNSNQGPGLAHEAGRQLVRGEFIQYLDSDDLLSTACGHARLVKAAGCRCCMSGIRRRQRKRTGPATANCMMRKWQ